MGDIVGPQPKSLLGGPVSPGPYGCCAYVYSLYGLAFSTMWGLVGPFHFREAIPRSGGLGWLAPALSDF